jgi:3-deoxy-D-manno-octulosonic-acid transferase
LLKKPAVSFSKINEPEIDKYDVLIIDSIGLLSSVYRYGKIAYIGGGFGVGIHNILEAATFGLPVIFGPNYKKFKEAVDLISEGGSFSISSSGELRQTLDSLINDENIYQNSSKICSSYVAKNVGSTKHIINKVFNIHPVLG